MKLCITAILATAAAMVLSCAPVGPDPGLRLTTREFTATISPASTKTSLTDQGKVLWDESGESISIIDTEGRCFTLSQKSVSGDRRTATFTGQVPESGCTYAIYPAQAEVDYSGGLFSLSIPTEQEAVPGGFDTATNLAISKVSGNDPLQFRNVCGLLGFTVNSDNVCSIRFSAREKSSGALTGTALVEFTGGEPECVSDVDKGAEYVEIEGDIQNGTLYYAIVYPGTYSSLEVTFTDTEGRTATFSKNSTLTLERNKAVKVSPFTIAESDWVGGEVTGGSANLTYSEISSPSTYVKGYGNSAVYSNSYGDWTICAYNASGAFQLNADKVAYITTPVMPDNIKSLIITNASDRSGNLIACTQAGGKMPAGSQASVAFKGAGTYTIDTGSLNARQLSVYATAMAHITAITVVWGDAEAPDPGTDPEPDPGTDPSPQPDPDPDAKADYGWFELPAQADHDHNGIDDKNSDYYYSHTFREDAPRIRNFSCCYSKSKMQPVWVAAPMHNCYKGNSGRNDSYKADPNIKCAQTSKVDGYTRGHMLGSSDRTVSKPTNRQVFYYSNIGAQLQSGFNTGGGAWNNLESLTDGQWCSDTLYQVIGCIFTRFTDRYGKTVEPKTVGSVQIPTAYYKVLLRTKSGSSGKKVNQCSADELKCAAFIIAHRSNAGHKPTANDMYTVSDLEGMTGLNFFVNVPNAPKTVAKASDWNL